MQPPSPLGSNPCEHEFESLLETELASLAWTQLLPSESYPFKHETDEEYWDSNIIFGFPIWSSFTELSTGCPSACSIIEGERDSAAA